MIAETLLNWDKTELAEVLASNYAEPDDLIEAFPAIARAGTMEGRSMHDNEDYAVGFDVSIPVFTFGRTRNRVSQAQAELEAARAQEKAVIQ